MKKLSEFYFGLELVDRVNNVCFSRENTRIDTLGASVVQD